VVGGKGLDCCLWCGVGVGLLFVVWVGYWTVVCGAD